MTSSTTPIHGQTFRGKEGDLDRAGVRGLRVPITVLDRKKKIQTTVATLALSVAVPHKMKDGYIDGFMKVLAHHRGEFTMRTLPRVLKELQAAFSSESAHVSAAFPYFIQQGSSGSLSPYDCRFEAESNGDRDDFILGVTVPLHAKGPAGAQHAALSLQVRSSRDKKGHPELIWIEELVAIAEMAGSRSSNATPFFSEALKEAAGQLRKDRRMAWFKATLEQQADAGGMVSNAQTEWWSPCWGG